MTYSKSIHEFTATITKASFDKERNIMRFRMVASDTGLDVFDERMSLQLFNDFTSRIESGTTVPSPFGKILEEKSGWKGGMPYVSVAHYKSGIEGKNIPADTEKVYVDGECLKATAICRNTPLGTAVFNALKSDLEGNTEPEDKIKVSIGFLDLSHSHGDMVFERTTLDKSCPMCENNVGNKVYLKGQLVHLALTRRPANPRTDATLEETMDIQTRKDDASSIVGESLAEDIEINKTALDDIDMSNIITVKSDVEVEEKAAEHDAACTCKACATKKKAAMGDHPEDCTCKACASKKNKAKVKGSNAEEQAEGPSGEAKEPASEDVAEGESPAKKKKSALDISYESLKSRVLELKSLSKEDALREIQPSFDSFAAALQEEFVDVKSTAIVASIDPALSELLVSMKSMIEKLDTKVSTLNTELTIMKSQKEISQVKPTAPVTPARNLQVERSVQSVMDASNQKPMSIAQLALRSVQN